MAQQATANYQLGSVYAVTAAALMATQEPFSFPAAKHLNSVEFVLITQSALAISIPLLIAKRTARRDFVALLTRRANWTRLAAIFAIGMTGLLLYNFGLSNAHPIIIAAVLNLSPFWAAMVARFVSGLPIPVAPPVFFGCLGGAFAGAMAVAWSQLSSDGAGGDLASSLFKGSWIFAVPIPILSALNGTLIGRWFAAYDESAAIAANFLVPVVALVPGCLLLLASRGQLHWVDGEAVALMIFGTIVAASIGRVFYQVALSATDGDNGFVTMFFLLVPALTGLISAPMSLWISDLQFRVNGAFFVGLALIAASLLAFSLKSWRRDGPAPLTATPAPRSLT